MAGPRAVAHLTVDERIARGKAARTEVPRSSHAGFAPLVDRRDPIEILQHQAASRVPALIPIRYGRMVASPFTFYRGAAAIMAADLATTPNSGLRAQLCGDAHLSNFGVFSSPERRLVFDINDFDETIPGPWEWDVKRLAVSFEVAGRSNGFTAKERAGVLASVLRTYRESMRDFAAMPNLEVWYAKLEVDQFLAQFASEVSSKTVKRVKQQRAKALSRDSVQAFSKMTEIVDGKAQFLSQPPLLVRLADMFSAEDVADYDAKIRENIRSYRRTLPDDRRHLLEEYQIADVAHKVVGVGSVGTRAWVLLMLGRDQEDPLLLQVKQAQESVLAPYVGKSAFANAGQRVVAGQRLMQASSDIFLGWNRQVGIDDVPRDFYIRQLRDGKASAVIETMTPRMMEIYAVLCGWTLARAHARSGDRIAISAYLGNGTTFDKAVAKFSDDYADQNEVDHAALVDAINQGRIEAQVGV